MRLEAEFTTEPFVGGGEPPAHARAALRVVEAAGLACEFGPLGTSVAGEDRALIAALADVLAAAFEDGASRVTVQVQRAEG